MSGKIITDNNCQNQHFKRTLGEDYSPDFFNRPKFKVVMCQSQKVLVVQYESGL